MSVLEDHNNHVDVLNLDDEDGMYERAGRAEVLRLDGDDSSGSDVVFNNEQFLAADDRNRLRLPLDSVRSNVSENKNVQTDLSFAKSNKRSQTTAAVFDMSDSDGDDNDIANQSLSQSQALGLRSFNDPGFLNAAMQTLMIENLRKQSQQQQLQHQFEDQSDFDKSHRSLLSYPGRAGYSRHNNNNANINDNASTSRESKASTTNNSNRRFSVRPKKPYNYYNGSRTPPEPSYSETKASMLRRKTMNAEKHPDHNHVRHRSREQQQRLSKRLSMSAGDLSGLVEVDTPEDTTHTTNSIRRMSSND